MSVPSILVWPVKPTPAALTLFACLLAWNISLASDGGAANCQRPRVLIVLDKSSSMVTGMVGGQTKWDVAKQAITTVVTKYDKSIDFGLLLFPNPSQCGWGKVVVGVGPQRGQQVVAQLVSPPPKAGNWTPMAQSLDVAGKVQNLQTAGFSNNVLLITDGWQWCDPYDSKTRFLPVNSATSLKAKGITTYVVGFGSAVDVLTLNRMAVAAGTKVSSSCDPTSNTTTGKNCYHQASKSADLLAALQSIALTLTQEKCDKIDNDCNGKVDDGLNRACSTKCGNGTESCAAGIWGNCSAPKPAPEKCDGKDNNCDGTVDEGCNCLAGATRPCGNDVGECAKGTQTCTGGKWGNCAGETKATPEKCDNKDNDCDTKIDEDLIRACSSKCGAGKETCILGKWINCSAPQPTQEICDGLDNDCDGTTDGPTAVCANLGVCKGGICVKDLDLGAKVKDSGGPSMGFNPTNDIGCDCTVSESSPGGGILFLLVVGLIIRRRRRRR